MRRLVAVTLGLLSCTGSKAQEGTATTASGVPASSPTRKSDTRALPLDSALVTLLQPEGVIAERIDVESLADLLKRIDATIIAYKGSLPDDFDAFVAARAGAIRVWLASATGDLPTSELDKQLEKLEPAIVRSGTVAVVIRFVRSGSAASERKPFLPSPWKAAADAGGSPIDIVIDRVWPPH